MRNFSTVICVGQEIRLLDVRSQVLRTRFATVLYGGPADLYRLLAQHPFDLLVLCHTLSEEESHEAAARFLACNPGGAILAMYTHHTTFSLKEADASVPALAGPQRMFHAVDGLQQHGMPRFALSPYLQAAPPPHPR